MSEHIDHIEFRLEEEGTSPESSTDENVGLDSVSPSANTISAEVLANVLLHTQQAVYLLALAARGQEIRQRFRVPGDIKEKFALQCEIPQPGSYIQPLALPSESDLLGPSMASGPRVLGMFKSVASSIGDGDWQAMQSVVGDSAIRRRLVKEFADMLPEPGEGWTLRMQNGQGPFAYFDEEVAKRVRAYDRKLRAPEETVTEPVVLAGEVTKIDFAERKFTIRHYPSSRALDCEYNEELEEMLVENRRGLIQVSGLVERNEKDEPIRLTNVFEVREVDTSDIVVSSVPVAGGLLRFQSGPKSFKVELDESGTLLIVEDEDLGVHAYAETREQLRDVLAEELDIVWTEYAAADAGMLTPAAARLGERLRDVLELVPQTPGSDA